MTSSDSTSLLVRSDPEEFFRLLAGFSPCSKRSFGDMEVSSIKSRVTGARLLWLSRASRGLSERAVRASLELIASCDRLQKLRKVPFNLRVAVATSLVVIASDGSGIVGTAPVLASRLQGEAKANTVVVADIDLSTYPQSV